MPQQPPTKRMLADRDLLLRMPEFTPAHEPKRLLFDAPKLYRFLFDQTLTR
ncbi:hypothetical protein [Sulfoacidibacillus thermotolerans]|uniref:hypothetical protein n=1 Tax=Sulfoacidibacillus thermotolerans TaxID=1765684 RepID=UPI0015E82097|nr:hypothetical protein [Sulfoacidibacillus thermotolerans]